MREGGEEGGGMGRKGGGWGSVWEGRTDVFTTVLLSLLAVFCREPTAFGEDDYGATTLHHAARKGEDCALLRGHCMSSVE